MRCWFTNRFVSLIKTLQMFKNLNRWYRSSAKFTPVQSVFNGNKLNILRKNENFVKLSGHFVHPCPCFHLMTNDIPDESHTSQKKNAIFEGMTAAHGERWKTNISSLFPLHQISVPVSPRPMVQWLFNKITFFRVLWELRKTRFWATNVNLSPRVRRHTSETFLVCQTKGKMVENRLPGPTSGVLATHVNPAGLGAGPFPYALTRTILYH